MITWFHERTTAGWDIFDENRLLIAVLPDAQHQHEADAEAIASAPGGRALGVIHAGLKRPLRPWS